MRSAIILLSFLSVLDVALSDFWWAPARPGWCATGVWIRDHPNKLDHGKTAGGPDQYGACLGVERWMDAVKNNDFYGNPPGMGPEAAKTIQCKERHCSAKAGTMVEVRDCANDWEKHCEFSFHGQIYWCADTEHRPYAKDLMAPQEYTKIHLDPGEPSYNFDPVIRNVGCTNNQVESLVCESGEGHWCKMEAYHHQKFFGDTLFGGVRVRCLLGECP